MFANCFSKLPGWPLFSKNCTKVGILAYYVNNGEVGGVMQGFADVDVHDVKFFVCVCVCVCVCECSPRTKPFTTLETGLCC